MTTPAPYGSWDSPISIDALIEGRRRMEGLQATDTGVFWLEGRPENQGRTVLVRRTPDGTFDDVTPGDFDVRTRVHEYGGGAFAVHGGTVWCVENRSQRIHRVDAGGTPVPITAASEPAGSVRYADLQVTPDGRYVVAVRERHGLADEAVNDLVILPADGSGEPEVLADGRDFFSSPRVSPDGRQVAWICWDHPNLPWDDTELWLTDLDADGVPGEARRVAGGRDESVVEPLWRPDGVLHVVSDRTGWWNVYRLEDDDLVACAPMPKECANASWTFGQTSYTFLPDGRIVATAISNGREMELVEIAPDGAVQTLASRIVEMDWLASGGGHLWCIGARRDDPGGVVCLTAPESEQIVRRRGDVPAELEVSLPVPVTFPVGEGAASHAFFYPPASRRFRGPDGELPPVIVTLHGGPTAARGTGYQSLVQFFASRGFAVADVNYRGSTGFGRPYRKALYGRSGLAEPEDCVAAARFLAERGMVDGNRLAIRGGSAGGYVVLTAMTFHDVFDAGISLYGIADLESLEAMTHKFESRYVDVLVGPGPDRPATLAERSPIHHADRIGRPVLLLQGADDTVVPRNQAEDLAAALDARGVPHALLVFEGEGHGFRRAETQRRSFEAELAFLGRVFGFDPGPDVPPLAVRHLDDTPACRR